MAERKKIEIPLVKMEEIMVRIGNLPRSSLLCNRFTEEAQRKIMDKQMKKGQKALDARDPQKEYLDSLYSFNGNGRYGFPAGGIKKSCVSSARFLNDAQMTQLRGALFVLGADDTGDLIEIVGNPRFREDIGRNPSTGGAAVIIRSEFTKWHADVHVRFNAGFLSAEQVVNLFSVAGFGVGIGDWRPEKGGTHGMFCISSGKRPTL